MIDPFSVLIIGLFVAFLASVAQGLTGFGFSLISVPIMMTLLQPRVVVPIVLIQTTLINLFILFELKKLVDLKSIWPLIVAGLVGAPLGTYLLIVLDAKILKILVGFIAIVFAVALLKGVQRKIKNEKLALVPIGFIGGLLNGSTTMSGPPVILFFINQGSKKEVLRASLATYFIALNFATIPMFLFNGLITVEVVKYSLAFSVAVIAGSISGIRISHRIKETLFRNVALAIVVVAGLLSILSSL